MGEGKWEKANGRGQTGKANGKEGYGLVRGLRKIITPSCRRRAAERVISGHATYSRTQPLHLGQLPMLLLHAGVAE